MITCTFFTMRDMWYFFPYILYVHEPNEEVKHTIEIGWLFFGWEFFKEFKGNPKG